MTGDRVRTSLAHREPDVLPVDFGGTFVTGIHVSCVAALRRHYGLGDEPVRVIDPGQMLGEIGHDLKRIMGIATECVVRRMTRFGFPLEDWKPWRMYDGLEVLVPGGFEVTLDENGDTLLFPQSDPSAPPSARMPKDGYFFDSIVRQEPIDEEKLDPSDNLEEYKPVSEADLEFLEREMHRAAATGRAVVASFGGTALGDIALVPGVGLKYPKGIRDVTEWYVSTRSRRDYIHKVFDGQCEVAIANLKRIAAFARGARMASIFHLPEYVQAGGLLSYGPDRNDLFRRAADYVDRILKGARPADLPVEQPVKYELTINMATARQIGLIVPSLVLAQAAELVE